MPIYFKGGSSSSSKRDIPAQTEKEGLLEDSLFNYAQQGKYNASQLQNQAMSAIPYTYNPDYNSLTNNYNNTMAGVASGYNNLANGQLPDSYVQGITNTAQNSLGKLLANKAANGVINSSNYNSGQQSIADMVSDNILNYSNAYSNVLNNQANQAGNILSNNAAAQQYSYYEPSQLLSYANQQIAPSSNLYNTMYSGRMGTSGVTTTTNDGGSGTWNAIGSIGSALITCFAAGTKIFTTDGNKNIEDIKVGDEVFTLSDNGNSKIEKVINIMAPAVNEIFEVLTTKGKVVCTATQPFITVSGSKTLEKITDRDKLITIDGNAELISIRQIGMALVYDFTVANDGVFFANGFAVEGWE